VWGQSLINQGLVCYPDSGAKNTGCDAFWEGLRHNGEPMAEREKKVPKIAAFTLIELMIVVAIIGILAAIAIPNFVKFQCRSKQSEAKTNLKAMYTSQETYRGEFDTYFDIGTVGYSGSPSNELGFVPKGQKIRYDYSLSVTTNIFTSTAVGYNDVNGDQWQINQENNLFMVNTACD
jgi:type IV pilus assembly protein PilA